MTQDTEAVTISVRARTRQRDLIDQAAERLGCSRSSFMLEAACRQAENVLLAQTYFPAGAASFAAFQALIENPPAASDRLRRTMKAPAPWNHSQQLLEAVQKGDAELDAGLGIPYTPEVLQALTEAALREMKSGAPINPDVLPEQAHATPVTHKPLK